MAISLKHTFIGPWLLLGIFFCVTACATDQTFTSQVKRFPQLPPPQGQSFVVVAQDPDKAGSLEFAHYAALVRNDLATYGYRPVEDAGQATLIAAIDYDVDGGREKIVSDPYFDTPPPFFRYSLNGRALTPWWALGGDPFFWDYRDTSSVTVYHAFLSLKIDRKSDGVRVYEGRAEADTGSNDLTQLVPNLVAALFSDFLNPSHKAERVRIPARTQR